MCEQLTAHPLEGLCHHLKLHSEDASLWPDHKHMTSLSFDAEIRGIKGHPCHTSLRANGIPTHSVTAAVHLPEPMFGGMGGGERVTLSPYYHCFDHLATTVNTNLISKSRESNRKHDHHSPPPKKEARVINLYDQSTKIVELL